MGIDVPALKHLIDCGRHGPFGNTLTIGRQEIHISNISSLLNLNKDYHGYCEEFLKDCFGATHIDSLDNSDYEQATILYDLNKKVEGDCKKYDTIIDFGTLEHVYHINNALYNLSKFCNPGGQIIHILPGNNFCGHGFWQFSPELFFSLYHEKNGYVDTEVFLIDNVNPFNTTKLSPPQNGQRLLIERNDPVYIAVRTVLKNQSFSHEHVQQSDYVHLWNQTKGRKIFIDCGTHLFQGFKQFSEKYNIDSSWKCYCFEVNPITYKKSKDVYNDLISQGYDIRHYNKAVYKENTKIKVNCTLDFDSKDNTYTNQSTNILETKPSIDKVYGGQFIYSNDEVVVDAINFSEFLLDVCDKDDFVLLKMDIEGSEFDVITSMINNGSYKLIDDFYCEWHDRFFEPQESYTNLKKEFEKTFKEQNITIQEWI